MKEILFSSDNAECYSHDIFDVVWHNLRECHDLNAREYVHPSVQCANGMLDSHFACLKRPVKH